MLTALKDSDTQNVRFGAGCRRDIGRSVDALGKSRALVLTTPEQSGLGLEMAEYLGARAAGVYSCAAMHTPVEVTQEAHKHALSVNADCLVAVGGGSTIGLCKALALRINLAQIALPTTYAGSEATPILGQTENGVKTTITDRRVLPEMVIYDPELVATLPAAMSATSGLNAMAHAVEALYAKDRTAETTRLALQGLGAFAKGLQAVMQTPGDLAAREETQFGAWACGSVLGRVGMALHHKLCHTLGGSFDMPHARTHAVILPHAIAYNEKEVSELLRPIAELLAGTTAGGALWDFARAIESPMTLKELGFERRDIERAADIAMRNPYWNPREITREGLLGLLSNAYEGKRPNTS